MAHSKQAKKRILQTNKRTERHAADRSRMRTFVKNAETTIASGDKNAIPTAFKQAMKELHIAVRKGLLKKKTASRKISRLAARIRTLAS